MAHLHFFLFLPHSGNGGDHFWVLCRAKSWVLVITAAKSHSVIRSQPVWLPSTSCFIAPAAHAIVWLARFLLYLKRITCSLTHSYLYRKIYKASNSLKSRIYIRFFYIKKLNTLTNFQTCITSGQSYIMVYCCMSVRYSLQWVVVIL